jgi:hypothetical protein
VARQLPTIRDDDSNQAEPDERSETEEERGDRNLLEFVQELRVGALGRRVVCPASSAKERAEPLKRYRPYFPQRR